VRGDPAPEVPIRLVISDIDGTLVNKAKELTPRARAAVLALQQRGIGFTVTSARPPVGLRHIIDLLGLKTPVAAVNGGALVNPDLSVIAEKLLPPAPARRAVALLRGQGIDAWLFTDTAWYIRDPHGAHVEHEAMTIDQPPTIVNEFDDALYDRVLKIVGASHDHPHLADCEMLLQRDLGPEALATRSQVYYLDVTNVEAHKGMAVTGLSQALGIPIEAILTIGDGINDIPMLRAAGFSVAMANGGDAVKAAAHVVTDDCETDGFAKAIERYVLGQATAGR
jgi:hypothetical protein